MNSSSIIPILTSALLLLWFAFPISASEPTPGSLESEAEAADRIAFLRSEIARHDDLYYRKAAPEISDAAYDALKRELRSLEVAFPEVAESLPGKPGIGDDRSGDFPTSKHAEFMLSLDKAYSMEALERFYLRALESAEQANISFSVEPKIDGMAISLVYEKGILARAVTRGNGVEGDVITENVKQVTGLPVTLNNGDDGSVPEFVELRGELYVSNAAFAALNQERQMEGLEAYRHPRNYAAGSAKLTDPEAVAERRLSVLIYGYGRIAPRDAEPESLSAFFRTAESWGLPVVRREIIGGDWEALSRCVSVAYAESQLSGLPVDGVVVKVNERAARERLGSSATAPRWAIAYKVDSQTKKTRVTEIVIQVSRTGRLSPVALLEPVDLSGARVERATLHNAAWIRDMDVREGDTVLVTRAGEVIPSIVGVDETVRSDQSRRFRFPERCPTCGRRVASEDWEVFCQNRLCPEVLKRRLEHFASSKAAGIRGLGPATIGKWVEAGIVGNLSDLYRLDARQLTALDGSLSVTEERILDQIELSKGAEVWRIYYGLGLPEIGPVRARELAEACGSLEGLAALSPGDFKEEGRVGALEWGPATSESLRTYLANEANREELRALAELGVGPR